MTFKVKVKDYRGIHDAHIELDLLTVLAGSNGQGKTSMADAIEMCFASKNLPSKYNLAKKYADQLIRDGASSSTITATYQGETCEITLPKADKIATGGFPELDAISLGSDSIVNWKADEVSRYVIGLTGIEVTIDDFNEALSKHLTPAKISELIKMADKSDWDSVAKKYKDSITQKKGAWREVTGEMYGSKKIQDWKPAYWQPEFATIASQDALEMHNQANKALHDGISKNAALRAKQSASQDDILRLPNLRDELNGVNFNIKKAQEDINDAKKQVKESNFWYSPGWKCPHCSEGIDLQISSNGNPIKLEKAGEVTNKQTQERNDVYSAAVIRQKDAEDCLQGLMSQVNLIKQQIATCEKAEEALKVPDEDFADIQKIEENLEFSRRRYEAILTKERAETLTKEIASMIATYDVIAMDGENSIRARKSKECIQIFNVMLKSYTEAADYRDINLNDDMAFTYNDRPYFVLSDSEKFRVRMTLQVMHAKRKNHVLCLVDGADILDNKGRNGAFNMILAKEQPAFFFATILWRDKLPNISHVNGCRSYWIEGGMISL